MVMYSRVQASHFGSSIGYFSTLPLEILELIISNIKDTPTLGKFSRTCKQLHSIMMPLFHKRFVVDIAGLEDIPKLIHAINPYLTIAQRYQLETESTRRYQQQSPITNIDTLDRPMHAGYVRQIVVGSVDQGYYYEKIIHQYLEEAFKNMNNMEVVETSVLKGTMAESIVSLQPLKALRLSFKKFPPMQDLMPLSRVRNLKHLYFDALDEDRVMMGGGEILQSMIVNSKSTLQSLVFRTYNFGSRFVPDSDQWGPSSQSGYLLTALKSLEISGLSVDETFVRSLVRAINFLGLRELVVGPFADGKHLFFHHLANLTRGAQSDTIRLQSVILSWMNNSLEMAQDHQAVCDFLSSFETLTTLTIANYLHLPGENDADTGLPDIVLQAAMNHKNLEILSFSYGGTGDWYKFPFLTPAKVASVLGALPHLRNFQFIMMDGQEEETGAVLGHGRRLTSISCWTHLETSSLEFDEVSLPFHGLLDGLLNSDRFISGSKDKLVWEDYSELRYLKVLNRTWEIGSGFRDQDKGLPDARQRFSRTKTRSVWYRDITKSLPPEDAEPGQPDSGWVDKVASNIDGPFFY